MENGNVNNNGQNGTPVENPQMGQQPQAQQPQPQQPQQQIVYVQQPEGWWKRNWKKVGAAAAAIGTAVASAAVAFSKGKKAGENEAYYQQEQQRSPLDPNV